MRVLFLATRDWRNPQAAGGDVQMWEYARYLAHRGHDVTFVASAFAGAPARESLDGLHVVRLGGIHSLWLRTFLYYMREGRNRCAVVVTEGFGGARIPRLAPLYVREPIITEWHQIHGPLFAAQYPRLLVPFLNALERLTAFVHRNTVVRAGTREWQERLPTLGFKPENIIVVPCSIRDEWIARTPPSAPRRPLAVWLGKFRRYKRPDHVIEAAQLVVKAVPDAQFLLMGRQDDQMLYERLQNLVRNYGLSRNVEFRLNVSEEEKEYILRQSRVLVLPSSVEGFGIVVLEANVCGLPVVASSGVPESVVRHEYNGLRYEFGAIPALATCIVRILADGRLHGRLSENSRAFAERFAWSSVGASFERLVISAATKGSVHHRGPESRDDDPHD